MWKLPARFRWNEKKGLADTQPDTFRLNHRSCFSWFASRFTAFETCLNSFLANSCTCGAESLRATVQFLPNIARHRKIPLNRGDLIKESCFSHLPGIKVNPKRGSGGKCCSLSIYGSWTGSAASSLPPKHQHFGVYLQWVYFWTSLLVLAMTVFQALFLRYILQSFYSFLTQTNTSGARVCEKAF